MNENIGDSQREKHNIDIPCPYKSANINPSPQQLQSLSSLPWRAIVKHGLVRIPVSIFATGGGEPATRAAKAATAGIPIVFYIIRNPVELGWLASLNRPGGNMTGVNSMSEELATKNRRT